MTKRAVRLTPWFLLLLALPSRGEVFLLAGRDAADQAFESRLELVAVEGGLRLERTTWTPERGVVTLRGAAERRGDAVRATLAPEGGLSGRLASAPALRAAYRIRDGRIQGRLRDGSGALLAQETGRALPPALDPAAYVEADAASAQSDGRAVDVAGLNADASALLRGLSSDARAAPAAVLVVPGYAVEGQTAPLHAKAKARARLAARVFRREGSQVLLLSGGNVHPTGTGFNEAVELRRFLLEARALPPWRIAVDPYARHTTTNLRNAGRFLLAHEVPRARVVTSRDQSFYLGAARISSFHARCRATLGYEVGRFAPRTHRITDYTPSLAVRQRGDDPLDP